MELNTGQLKLRGSVHGNFSCEWSIPNFSSLDWQIGKLHVSPGFRLDNEGIEWWLAISCEKVTEHSTVFFWRVGISRRNIKEEDINFRCNYSTLRNTDGEILCHGYPADLSDETFITPPEAVETFQLKLEDLISKLINDTLFVTIEATHSTVCYSGGDGIQCYKEFAPTLKILDDLKKLWISKENTDCVISVGGQDISVHSLILGACSEVFAAMFRHDTLEGNTRRVVTDFKKDTMDCFLEFIYSGSVLQMDHDLAFELLRARNKYEVVDLKS